MKVQLTSDEVRVAIARFAAEKAGWGWHRGVTVKGVDFEPGVVAELRDGRECSVLLTRARPVTLVTDDEAHYRSCLDQRCERCKKIAAERYEAREAGRTHR